MARGAAAMSLLWWVYVTSCITLSAGGGQPYAAEAPPKRSAHRVRDRGGRGVSGQHSPVVDSTTTPSCVVDGGSLAGEADRYGTCRAVFDCEPLPACACRANFFTNQLFRMLFKGNYTMLSDLTLDRATGKIRVRIFASSVPGHEGLMLQTDAPSEYVRCGMLPGA